MVEIYNIVQRRPANSPGIVSHQQWLHLVELPSEWWRTPAWRYGEGWYHGVLKAWMGLSLRLHMEGPNINISGCCSQVFCVTNNDSYESHPSHEYMWGGSVIRRKWLTGWTPRFLSNQFVCLGSGKNNLISIDSLICWSVLSKKQLGAG